MLRLEGVRSGAEVRGVDLELRRGEIVGLAGLQGQGQEELLAAVAGFRRLSGGAILHKGERVVPRLPLDMIRRGVCLVPNDRHRQGLFMTETVGAAYTETELRPTFKDPYTHEVEAFHAAVVDGAPVKTTPEDFTEDLRLFEMIIAALRQSAATA